MPSVMEKYWQDVAYYRLKVIWKLEDELRKPKEGKPEFEEYRTHFYWLGSAAEVMNREPKLPRGVRTEPYYDDFYHRDLLYKQRHGMNLGKPVYWTTD